MHTEHWLKNDFDLSGRLRQVESQIGRTPLQPIQRLFSKKGVRLFVKKEWEQLSGSVKARAAFSIVKAALESGQLRPGRALLDATSGNTGIAYAAIGKALGIEVVLCLPENASQERKDILRSLGAQIVFTSRFEGTDGAQEVARDLAEQYPERYFYADQYRNDNNWRAHYRTTAVEILQAVPEITHFVAGLGTTGTFVGTGRRLREQKPGVQLIALQPDSALHGLEGWKHLETAIVPGIYDPTLADASEEIDTAEAYEIIRAARKHEDLLLSPSAAANLAGALRIAERLDEGTVVTVLPDNADKYGEVMKQLFT
ncbi:MAG: cysteine synthase family protein [Saprospiraceae bacterium]|nr:cysteine synthase family protein [Saprospiraceae bacterium]MDW8230893.1 cysteine synthase family protein [Saprospiraceae bacterium]